MAKQNIYLISGLGANSKVFERLSLEGYSINYLEWLMPKKKETIEDYSRRMSENIDRSKPFFLIGLSFGGIIAQEISKIIPAEKIIIISSVKNDAEMPILYKKTAKYNLHKILPLAMLLNMGIISKFLFGTKKNRKYIIKKYFTYNNVEYLKWAIASVIKWKNTNANNNLLQINGSKDAIFPVKNIKDYEEIKNGTHLIIFTHAKEINKLIKNFLIKNNNK